MALTSFTVYLSYTDGFSGGCTYKAYVYEWDSTGATIVGNALFEGPTRPVSSLSTSESAAVTEAIPSAVLDPTK